MIYYAIIILIVIALSEMLKRLVVAAKVIPVVNIILSCCMLLSFTGEGINACLLKGVLLGVFVTGLYSGAKNIIEYIIIVLKKP